MAKRDLFNELVQGFEDIKAEREGKLTLKTTELVQPNPIKISAKQIAAVRKKLNQSQAVFAALLNTNVSTLRNWEQARSEPNAQAKVLLKMVDADPDVLSIMSSVILGSNAVIKKKPAKRKAAAKKKPAAKRKVASKKKAPAKRKAKTQVRRAAA